MTLVAAVMVTVEWACSGGFWPALTFFKFAPKRSFNAEGELPLLKEKERRCLLTFSEQYAGLVHKPEV